MRNLFGRRKIKTDVLQITHDNVLEVLSKAIQYHERNASEEDYLWKYYKGQTEIRYKTKEFRENINNIVSEERAGQIVEFYQGYIFGEPVQYIRRGGDESLSDEVARLNDIMYIKDKVSCDDELAEFMLVCGVCPRMVLPGMNGNPFDMYTLDPRFAFNVYFNDLGENVAMSVKYIVREDNTRVYSVYTADTYYQIEADTIMFEEPHLIGEPPIVEYALNNVRRGVFEPVLTLIDAINTLQSNRLDDVQQFVNNILAILGGEVSEDTMTHLSEWGALNLPEGVDAKYLCATLSQSDIEVLKNDLMSALTEITGMPNRNGGSSTSDTGSAVLLRDGWEIADAKAKRIENQFKKAEKRMLTIVLRVANRYIGNLSMGDVEIRFTRRNYEGIQTKSQVLVSMLNCGKVHPELAFKHCGMFADPQLAYTMSKEYYEKEVSLNEGNEGKTTATGEDREEDSKEEGAEE